MKKSIIALGLGLSLGSVVFNSSCSLDEPPQNQVTKENAFKTEKDLNSITTSIHVITNMRIKEDGLQTILTAGEIMDDVDASDVRAWNPRSVINSEPDWKNLYDIIFTAHFLLDNIHKTQGLSEERLNYHRGQALFSLGFTYLAIVQRYGDAILLENSERLSAYGLTPQLDVLNKAIEYAQEAYNILPTQGNLKDLNGATLTNKQFATKGSAAALLSELYAWKGSVIDNYKLTQESSKTAYEASIKYATEVISGKVGSYKLNETPEALCLKLSDAEADDAETIFSLAFDRLRDVGTITPSPAQYYVTWPVDRTKVLGDIVHAPFRIYAQSIKNLYTDEADQRPQAFFYKYNEAHTVGGQDYAVMYKWRKGIFIADAYSEAGEYMSSVNTNFTYWRLAEMYLLRAECYNKIGQTANAIQDLNVIRKRAGANAYPYNGESDLKKAIFQEQEKEFIGEGSRYWSVIRNGYWKTELGGRFQTLTDAEVRGGALHLPLPKSASKSNGITVNTLVRQSQYWSNYN